MAIKTIPNLIPSQPPTPPPPNYLDPACGYQHIVIFPLVVDRFRLRPIDI